MKIRDLRASLDGLKDDDDLAIPIEVIGVAIGSQPFLEVKGIWAGFDWDHGRVFVVPESPVHEAGEGYKLEQKVSRDRGEALAFIWMAVTSKTLPDDKHKLDSIRRTLKRFGFDRGHEDEQGLPQTGVKP